MASPTTKTKEASAITPRQKLEGHTSLIRGIIHLPDRQKIITCSDDSSLRVWNLNSGKQIGKDWIDEEDWIDENDSIDEEDSIGKDGVYSIALSPNGKKVVSGSYDGAVRLWDIDTCKVIAVKWTGHTREVMSVCWSRDGQRVLTGSFDGTARQWNMESEETILEPILKTIETGHSMVWGAVYSPDMSLIATSGWDGRAANKRHEHSIKIWDAKTGKLVATLKGHTWTTCSLAWTEDGKTLISKSYDRSVRTWDTTKWVQTAILEHADYVWAIAVSPNGRILASASDDETVRLWNLDNKQPISLPLQHAAQVSCVSFSEDGKLLATGCWDENAYTWDVTVIVKEAGLKDLLSDSKANKSVLYADTTRQRRPHAYRAPYGFFDGVLPDHSHSSARSRPHSSAQPGNTFIGRLFYRSPSDTRNSSLSSPLDWTRNILKSHRENSEEIELQGRSYAVVEVPYAKGKRRNASAREAAFAKQKMKALYSNNSTAGSSQPAKPNLNVARPSSQPQAAVSNSLTTPAVGDNTATSTPSRPDVMIRQAGLWTRFWLFIGCLSPEYQDGHH